MNEQSTILEMNDVRYGWPGRSLLEGLSISLEPGGFYFLTGPSGSGKTTFLRLCFQDLAISEGELRLFGKPVDLRDRDAVAKARRRIGIIHQDCKFLDHLPLRENITLPVSVTGRPLQSVQKDVDDLLDWVGLRHREDALPPELSGGERQRAALARAVVGSPDLIIADEPTGNVDWEMSEKILSLLVQLNRSGKTVLLATHDLPLIRSAKAQVSTRVMRLSDGKIKIAGTDL